MTVRNATILPTTQMRQFGRTAQLWYPATQNAYLLAPLAGSAMQSLVTAGTSVTLLENWTRGLTSISFTPSTTPGSAFTFAVSGLNQFGVATGETVTLSGSANIVHTVKCYSRITSIIPTAAPNEATTIAIGWTCVVTSGTPRLAMTFKPAYTSSIKAVTLQLATGALPTFTPEVANYTIAVSASPLLNATVGGHVLCYLDENDPNF